MASLGLNFVLYLISSERLRAAYWTFLKDGFFPKKMEDELESRVWWSRMLHRSMSGISDIITGLAMLEGRQDNRQTSSVTIDIASGTISYKI